VEKIAQASPEESMNTEQVTVKGRDYSRTVWFSGGPKHIPHPLCVFLGGEYYLKMELPSILEKLIASGRIPEMSFAIVSQNGDQSRHEDNVCNDQYARFVAEDLFSWAKGRVDSIRADRNIICGLSLSGLASAHIHLTFPHVFSSSLSQSGSFWWNGKSFAGLVREPLPATSRYWLSVGDEETEESAIHAPSGMRQEFSQIVGVQSAVDALKSAGAEVVHREFHGGHSFEPWINELPEALEWLTESHQLRNKVEIGPNVILWASR
jgi:enterochelin esterase-like enzyme